MPRESDQFSLIRAPIAVVLAWLVPGLGHIYLGHRLRGIVFMVTITLTFWTGVAIGGVKTVSPYRPVQIAVEPQMTKSWWFFAQLLNGSYAIAGYQLSALVDYADESGKVRYLSWPSADVAYVYTGIAGLLNLLIIMDALARAEIVVGLSVAGAGPPSTGRKRHG